ncbi:hypothetical protein [Vibrio sp. 10N.222.54.A3]|uniref:hypothetical protein n=1 Tax=Vibrio sp. 10N.222.54.A3 TaxID=3229633 RepID=UPI00354FB47D
MNIKVITGNDPEFLQRANDIINIYNETCPSCHQESLNLSRLDALKLIYVDGVAGGVITDEWCNSNGEFMFHSIMFAAFPKESRNQGYLKACLTHCGFPVETVQINDYDPVDIWKKLGFNLAGTMGMTIMLRSRDFEGVKWGLCYM